MVCYISSQFFTLRRELQRLASTFPGLSFLKSQAPDLHSRGGKLSFPPLSLYGHLVKSESGGWVWRPANALPAMRHWFLASEQCLRGYTLDFELVW